MEEDAFSGDECCQFFDAPEDISVMSGTPSDDDVDGAEEASSSVFAYDIWLRSPGSVRERRCEFFCSMGICLDGIPRLCSSDGSEYSPNDVDRVKEGSGAVLRNSGFKGKICSSSSLASTDESDWSRELAVKEVSFVCRAENLNGATECCVDDVDKEGTKRRESEKTSSSCSSALHPLEMEDVTTRSSKQAMRTITNWWLGRLRSFSCVKDRQGVDVLNLGSGRREGPRAKKVKVRNCGKISKELSALFTGQEFQAHKGAILKMKFSPDGQYLASAGEDGIVRLWQVVEDDRCNDLDIPEIDPSCIYFTVNHVSKLTPHFVDKEKMGKLRILRKTSDSACVVFPPKIFRLLERPLCEFHGHRGEILDLAWSNDNCLLSASTDKTVRLWQLGCDCCLGVFRHSNYVTCVQFNPTDNRQFVTGSLDGKLRIWDIPGSHVVEWTDMKEIVTAVCYRPDGQGVVVGCMSGSCRFYCFSDNHLQLDGQVCLCNKKKAPCKRITGIEFLPRDSSKVMVTSADSQIRILDGLNVISRYRGNRSAGNQMFASFTTDGKHIISASEDSGVCLWNCNKHDDLLFTDTRIIRSHEHFASNASVAIPWCGMRKERADADLHFGVVGMESQSPESLPYSPACFFLGQEFFLESFPKSSATWPEEKLPSPTSPVMHKTQYNFLRSSCQSTSNSHAWGLVIVTAGWDGRIRSFLNYGLPVTR